jgi:hypothetical protein
MKLAEFILAFRDRAADTKGKCFYCGVQTHKQAKESHAVFHTRDHVIPASAKLGDNADSRANRVVCCRRCNGLKEDLTLYEFKRRAVISTFYAETLLGVRIDDLEDIEEITTRILATRKIDGRSIKINGKPQPRTREVSALDLQPSTPSLEPSSDVPASN